MKRLVILALALALGASLAAQISIREIKPVSFSERLAKADVPVIATPSIDLDALKAEDLEDEEWGRPPRFGYPHQAGWTLENSGVWTVLKDGRRVWRLTIACPAAKSINLLYDAFWLAPGATLHIYNEQGTQVLGAFTERNNNSPRGQSPGYATGLVYGDKITLELCEPADVAQPSELSIAQVVHGYRYIRAFNDSGNCQVNVNCADGSSWQLEKTSVAMIIVGGFRWCTGSLMNNTVVDFTPYFLTANHCLDGVLGTWDAVGNPNAANWSFMWNYESPDCVNPASDPVSTTTTGAIVVANRVNSDFALLRLTEDPWLDAGLSLLYNGWSTDTPGAGGAGIHHPSGDVKKISLYQQTPWDGSTQSCLNANRWGVVFQHPDGTFTTTEGGSSGSPLYDNNHRVIGQLWGGFHLDDCSDGPTCSNPAKDLSFYGKFSVSWDGAEPRRRLRDWLAPECHTDLTINTDIAIGAPTFHASNAIAADNEISGAVTYVVYNGGFEVALLNGFEVRDGANFIARNFNCATGSFSAMDGQIADLTLMNDLSLTELRDRPQPESERPSEGVGEQGLSVFPNPAGEWVSIQFEMPSEGAATVQVFNAQGQLMRVLESGSVLPAGLYSQRISVGDWPSGMYYVAVRANGRHAGKAFVVSR
ncbi:MAG: T9SS type A sorting domain-containing protein [Saprospiraceae bacterium]